MGDVHDGLPRATLTFLADLAANNSRDWMAAHREDYDRFWKAAGLDLAAALSGPAADLGLTVLPRIDGSLRRLNRDTRFAADKRPFHTHLHLILSAGEPIGKRPGVHLVIGPAGLDYGVGEWGMSPRRLAAFRAAVLAPARRAALLAMIAAARAIGCGFGPPDLARLPRGLAVAAEDRGESGGVGVGGRSIGGSDHNGGDWDHLLRRKHFVLRTQDPRPLPEAVFTPGAAATLIEPVETLAPVAHWLAALE